MPKKSENARKLTFRGADFLAIVARRESFVVLRDWLNEIAAELKIDDKTRKQLLIVADEVFTNIATYAYPNGVGETKIEAEVDDSQRVITLNFTDSGVPFDPLKAPEPELSKPSEEPTIGGLGIFMTRRLTDAVEYRRENNLNILTLKKKLGDLATR